MTPLRKWLGGSVTGAPLVNGDRFEAIRGMLESPASVLEGALVDLVSAFENGVPEREWVPGCEGWLIAGKRYLLVGRAGGGKSLFALIVAVAVIAAGGRVAILDVENGRDEYGRRLADILGEDANLIQACRERLSYFEWPRLLMSWSAEEWAGFFEGQDLVIFDSSRMILTSASLNEDGSNDYADFIAALVLPLTQAGIATFVLDNVGHEGRRARGTKAKEDLNEVAYLIESSGNPSRSTAGFLRLTLTRTRFGDVPAELNAPVGAGTYGPITTSAEAVLSDEKARLVSEVQKQPGRSTTDLAKAVGKRRPDTASRLKELEKAGRLDRRTSEGRDKAGRRRPFGGWYPASEAGSPSVPLAGTSGTPGGVDGPEDPTSPLYRAGRGGAGSPEEAGR